jgi:hypothetical protein
MRWENIIATSGHTYNKPGLPLKLNDFAQFPLFLCVRNTCGIRQSIVSGSHGLLYVCPLMAMMFPTFFPIYLPPEYLLPVGAAHLDPAASVQPGTAQAVAPQCLYPNAAQNDLVERGQPKAGSPSSRATATEGSYRQKKGYPSRSPKSGCPRCAKIAF